MDGSPQRRADAAVETAHVFAVFGPGGRRGYWEPAERVEVTSLFGQVRLDFAEANLLEGVTEVRCLALFGNVEILVPCEIEVDAHGTAIFGGFQQREAHPGWLERLGRRALGQHPDPDSDLVPAEDVAPPVLRIRGTALFGNVTIRVG